MALTDEQIIACWERACYGLGKYEKFARAIESAACAERDARIAELERENAKLKTMPMKYRRLAFNAELQEKVAELERQLAEARKDAERWRFVYDPQSDGYAVCEYFHDGWIPISADCVDAAMQKG